MFNSYGELWSNLLFKVVGIPFVLLVMTIAAHQAKVLYQDANPQQVEPGSTLVGDTLF